MPSLTLKTRKSLQTCTLTCHLYETAETPKSSTASECLSLFSTVSFTGPQIRSSQNAITDKRRLCKLLTSVLCGRYIVKMDKSQISLFVVERWHGFKFMRSNCVISYSFTFSFGKNKSLCQNQFITLAPIRNQTDITVHNKFF